MYILFSYNQKNKKQEATKKNSEKKETWWDKDDNLIAYIKLKHIAGEKGGGGKMKEEKLFDFHSCLL